MVERRSEEEDCKRVLWPTSGQESLEIKDSPEEWNEATSVH